MKFQRYTDLVLARDLPEHRLKRGNLVKLVEHHLAPYGTEGCILLGESQAMRISYDAEIDALYIRLLEGKHECRSVRLSDEVALNIGAGEKLVGIEILDAKEVLGSGKIPAVMLEGLESATTPLALRECPLEDYGSASETGPSTK